MVRSSSVARGPIASRTSKASVASVRIGADLSYVHFYPIKVMHKNEQKVHIFDKISETWSYMGEGSLFGPGLASIAPAQRKRSSLTGIAPGVAAALR